MAKEKPYVNDMRNERTQAKEGGNIGGQGGYGSGQVTLCSEDGKKGAAPNFKPAEQVIGEPIYGEQDVPGTNIVKGASTVGYDKAKKGSPGGPLKGGKAEPPSLATGSGYK